MPRTATLVTVLSSALLCLILLVVSCGGVGAEQRTGGDDGGDEHAERDASASPKCGDQAVRIAEYIADVPEAGRSAI